MRNTSRNFCTRVYSFYFQCPEYCGLTMKMHGLISWVLLFCLLNPAHCLLTKRRLCVEYKREHYLINTTYIATLHTETENNCMTSCVRLDPCMAFNYHLVQKKCILMPQVQCMAPNSFNSSWYLFVNLQSCKRQQVWFSVRPADGNWHWITTDDPSNNTDILHVDGVRYVSRILYRGYYLPGWWNIKRRRLLFRTVDPATSQVISCPRGEFLAFSGPLSYKWSPYTAGDPLPPCALILSQLLDGTPLFIVRYQNRASRNKTPGFYNHVTRSTYVVNGGVVSPSAVEILCGINASTTF